MTPAEKLGNALMDLKSRSCLTAGAGGKLVEEALSAETRRRRLEELSSAASAVAFAARIAATDRLRPAASDEIVSSKLEALRKVIEECQFVAIACQKDTASAEKTPD